MDDSLNLPPATLAAALPNYKFDGARPDLFDRAFRSWIQYYGCNMVLEQDRPAEPREGEDLETVQRKWDELNERAVLCLAKCTTTEVFGLLRGIGIKSNHASLMLATL
jgi:hypothetical protein